jgi:hypothetical protein
VLDVKSWQRNKLGQVQGWQKGVMPHSGSSSMKYVGLNLMVHRFMIGGN